MDEDQQPAASVSAVPDSEPQSKAAPPKDHQLPERSATPTQDEELVVESQVDSASENEQTNTDAVEQAAPEEMRELEAAEVPLGEEPQREDEESTADLIHNAGPEEVAAADDEDPSAVSSGQQEEETTGLPAVHVSDIVDGDGSIENVEVPVVAAVEMEDESQTPSPEPSEVTLDITGTTTVQPDPTTAPGKQTKSPPTLFIMCLRSIGRNLKSFYNMRLYPPTAPTLSKPLIQALYPFDLSPLYLLEDQRCFERIAAMKRAHQERKRLKYRSPDQCFRQESVALYALGSSLEDPLVAPLSALLSLEPQPEHRLRAPNESDPNAAQLQKRRAKWVSDVENQPPQQENTSSGDSRQLTQKPTELKELKFHRQTVTNVGCGYIAEMMQGQSSLVNLSLQNCQITCAGAVILANALKPSKTLRRLDLSNNDSKAFRGDAFVNDIRGVGASALASALERNRSLVYLSLSCNHVGVIGAIAIAAMLQKNATLRRLELIKTDVDEAAADLIRAFERSSSLEVLNLQWCVLRPGLGSHLAKIQAVKSTRQPQRSQREQMPTETRTARAD